MTFSKEALIIGRLLPKRQAHFCASLGDSGDIIHYQGFLAKCATEAKIFFEKSQIFLPRGDKNVLENCGAGVEGEARARGCRGAKPELQTG